MNIQDKIYRKILKNKVYDIVNIKYSEYFEEKDVKIDFNYPLIKRNHEKMDVDIYVEWKDLLSFKVSNHHFEFFYIDNLPEKCKKELQKLFEEII